MASAIDQDLTFLRQAIRLAMNGRGGVEPNPMVGCLLVRNGQVIGRGFHRRFGGPHAEPQAIADAHLHGQATCGATAYVTLEPCCHTSKKTPPCVPVLIEAQVSRVVVACSDPNPQVSGRGLEQLRAAGIEVSAGIMEAEGRQLIAPYIAGIVHRRPYVTLKWAQSADGKVAGPAGKRTQISNAASMRLVQQLRARSDAILVGVETVLKDDPLLTARDVENARPLIRCVVDTNLRLPAESRLIKTTDQGRIVLYCSRDAFRTRPDAVQRLVSGGVLVVPTGTDSSGRIALPDVLHDLYARGATHLLVEGGPTVAKAFIAQNLADRAWVFESTMRIESPTAPAAPRVEYPATGMADVEGDRLTEHLNPQSSVHFALEQSADWVLRTA